MSLWEYNGIKLEIDLEDADFMQKYESAFNKMAEEEKEVKRAGMGSEFIISYVGLFERLFDRIFGPGTANDLFNGKKNARIADECYESFLDCVRKSTEEANKRRNAMVSKYSVKRRK